MRDGRLDRQALRIASALLAAAALALALGSCGGGSPAASAKARSDGDGAVKSRADLARQRPRAVGASGRCQAQVGGFLTALERLRRNLVVGLSYEQYVGELKAIRRAYAAIPTDRVALGCLRAAGTPGERGLNEYIGASNTWTDCVEVPGCESASIEGQLQGQWHEAARYLSKAEQGLRRLGAS
jgi:hypothetical protein